jgi:hypothetical protein
MAGKGQLQPKPRDARIGCSAPTAVIPFSDLKYFFEQKEGRDDLFERSWRRPWKREEPYRAGVER